MPESSGTVYQPKLNKYTRFLHCISSFEWRGIILILVKCGYKSCYVLFAQTFKCHLSFICYCSLFDIIATVLLPLYTYHIVFLLI